MPLTLFGTIKLQLSLKVRSISECQLDRRQCLPVGHSGPSYNDENKNVFSYRKPKLRHGFPSFLVQWRSLTSKIMKIICSECIILRSDWICRNPYVCTIHKICWLSLCHTSDLLSICLCVCVCVCVCLSVRP